MAGSHTFLPSVVRRRHRGLSGNAHEPGRDVSAETLARAGEAGWDGRRPNTHDSRAVSRECRREVSGVAAAAATTLLRPTITVAVRARVIAV